MEAWKKKIKRFQLVVVLGVMTLVSAGCVGAGGFGGNAFEGEPVPLPPVPAFAADLEDIELPPELKWQRKKSLSIKTESFRGGVYHYSGRVELTSLHDFLLSSMRDHQWKVVGEANAERVLLAFVKPSRNCMMELSESGFGETILTLYITIDNTSNASLNPFGEPLIPAGE